MSVKRAAVLRAAVSALVIAAVAVTGLLISSILAEAQKKDHFERRKVQATTAAVAIDAEKVKSLKGDGSDLSRPEYRGLREQLLRIKRSDRDIRFVYLMRPRADRLVFLADSEDPSSPDYSPPGQVYQETAPGDLDVFLGRKPPDTEIEEQVADRWGSWVSATAYVIDEKGRPIALLGTDVDVEKALQGCKETRRLGISFTAIVSALLAVVATQWILWRHGKDRREALRKEVEASLLRLNKELIRADRMKSDFIELASHELRNPVNAVNLAVTTMEKALEGKLSEGEEMLVAAAGNGSRRLVDLVNNLLDLTRLESGDMVLTPEKVELRELLTRTASLFKPLASEKGLELSLDLPGADIDACLDAQSLMRVTENLLSNAIKFTETGRVVLSMTPLGKEILRFAVSDTGAGIPEEVKKEVFKKFTRFHATGDAGARGAGLGLALCRALVEAQGGRIWFETQEGKGSTFYFEIPRYARG